MHKIFTRGEKKLLKGLKNWIFLFHHDDEDSRSEDNDENDIRDNNGLIDYEKLERLINLKRRSIMIICLENTLNIKIPTVCLKTCRVQETQKKMIFK